MLAIRVAEEWLQVTDGVLLVIDVEGALHWPTEGGAFGEKSPYLNGVA